VVVADIPAGALRHPGGCRSRLQPFLQAGVGLPPPDGLPAVQPFVRLEYRHKTSEAAQAAAEALAGQLRAWLESQDRRATELIGPAPCFFSRENGLYRWQIVLRGPDPASLLRGRSMGEWRIEVDPPSLL